MSGGKFLSHDNVRDKIIESFFFQFIFNHLRMIRTQEKFTNEYEAMCMSGGEFLKE